MSDTMSGAKAALAHARDFSKQVTGKDDETAAPPKAKVMAAAPKTPRTGDDEGIATGLAWRASQGKALGTMHTGGMVPEDGNYTLKMGEKVMPEHRGKNKDLMDKGTPLMAKASGPGTSAASTDDSHVKALKPIELKKRELDECK